MKAITVRVEGFNVSTTCRDGDAIEQNAPLSVIKRNKSETRTPLNVFRLIGGKKTLFRRKASVQLSNGYFHSFPRTDPQDSLPLCENSRERIATRDSCDRSRAVSATTMHFSRFYDATKRAAPASSPLMDKNAPAVKHYKENVKISRKMRNLIKREKLSFE